MAHSENFLKKITINHIFSIKLCELFLVQTLAKIIMKIKRLIGFHYGSKVKFFW
jgi:hypothetical protein